ncbi:MAG: hypothetical protein AABX00_01205 [Nanoarchaeota archaeon]
MKNYKTLSWVFMTIGALGSFWILFLGLVQSSFLDVTTISIIQSILFIVGILGFMGIAMAYNQSQKKGIKRTSTAKRILYMLVGLLIGILLFKITGKLGINLSSVITILLFISLFFIPKPDNSASKTFK